MNDLALAFRFARRELRGGLRGFRVVKQRRRQGPFTVESESVDRSQADLIVGVNGEKTTTADEFLNAIESHRPGEEVVLNIVREGHEVAIRLKLSAAES